MPLSNKAIYILKPFPDGKKRLLVPSNWAYNANLKGVAELIKLVPRANIRTLAGSRSQKALVYTVP